MSWSIQTVLDDFTPKLAAAPTLLPAYVTEAIAGIGAEMIGFSRAICPVRTGYLRSTIYFRLTDQMEAEFSAFAYYAMYVEYGTFRMAAQPFIRPTLDAYIGQLTAAILHAVLRVFD